jgi:hypothetical protein
MCFLLFSCPSSERELLRPRKTNRSPNAKSSLRSVQVRPELPPVPGRSSMKIKTQDEILAGEARPRRAFSRGRIRAPIAIA